MYVKAQARIFLALLGKGAILFNKVRLTFRLKFRSRGKRRKRSVSMHVAIHNYTIFTLWIVLPWVRRRKKTW